MSSHSLTYALIHRRGSRAFFLTRSTQHVPSIHRVTEVARAVLALAAVTAWGAVALLLAG